MSKAGQTKNAELIYDGQCPVCRTYCENLSPDDAAIDIALVDAREPGNSVDEVNKRGLDIDEGMVLKIDGELYYGSDAMYQIARRSQKKGMTGFLNRVFFNTPRKARFFYPAGKFVRNILLRILRIPKINADK